MPKNANPKTELTRERVETTIYEFLDSKAHETDYKKIPNNASYFVMAYKLINLVTDKKPPLKVNDVRQVFSENRKKEIVESVVSPEHRDHYQILIYSDLVTKQETIQRLKATNSSILDRIIDRMIVNVIQDKLIWTDERKEDFEQLLRIMEEAKNVIDRISNFFTLLQPEMYASFRSSVMDILNTLYDEGLGIDYSTDTDYIEQILRKHCLVFIQEGFHELSLKHFSEFTGYRPEELINSL